MNNKKLFRNYGVCASTVEVKKLFRLPCLVAGFHYNPRLVLVDFLYETGLFAILRLTVRFPRDGFL